MPPRHVPFVLATALAALSACTPAQVKRPASLAASATALEVRGISPRRAGQPVTIGPYTARVVDDGATFAWSMPLPGGDLGRAARRYAFVLQSADATRVEVACLNRAWTAGRGDDQRLSIDLTRLAGPLLDCELHGADGARGRLAMSRTGADLDGSLELPGASPLPVRGTRAIEGSALPMDRPTGYAVGDAQRTLMLVDAVGGDRVHLDAALPAHQGAWFAAAAAALLLSDPELE